MFTPLTLGSLNLKHRVVLAPLTRYRADPKTLAPTDLCVDYYRQRATDGGLLVTEATIISPESLNERAPGIFTSTQTNSWKRVVDAVHAKGGLISMQLWHIGRVAHPSTNVHPIVKETGLAQASVSASAVRLPGKTREWGTGNKVDNAVPRELTTDEVKGRLAQDYERAARNAREAGFDAIEIHAAHGYLIDQFLNDSVNKRQDEFGGPVTNRVKILDVVLGACLKSFPASRIGIRLSPTTKTSLKFYECFDSEPDLVYKTAIAHLDKYKLAYLLLSEPRWVGIEPKEVGTDPNYHMPLVHPDKFRPIYSGPIIGAAGFTPATAKDTIEKNLYSAVAFGRWFISNPDLPERLRNGSPLNAYNRRTFYSGANGEDANGYTDYPDVNSTLDAYPLIDQSKIGASLSTAKL